MTRPRKRKGFKSVTVDDRHYSWHMNEGSGLVEINLVDAYTMRLEIDFGLYDPWLQRAAGESPSISEPEVVTPKFLEAAIRFALSNGWNPDAVAPAIRIFYRGGEFRTAENEKAKEGINGA